MVNHILMGLVDLRETRSDQDLHNEKVLSTVGFS